jgi:hypothetical protein
MTYLSIPKCPTFSDIPPAVIAVIGYPEIPHRDSDAISIQNEPFSEFDHGIFVHFTTTYQPVALH